MCTTETDSVLVFGQISANLAEIRFGRNWETLFGFGIGRNKNPVSAANRNTEYKIIRMNRAHYHHNLSLENSFFSKSFGK